MYAFICMCSWASDVHVIVYKDMCLSYGVINSSGSNSQLTHSYLSSLSSCVLWTMCCTTLQKVSITEQVSNVALSVNLSRNTYLHVMLSVFRHIHRDWRVGKVKLSNANHQIASTGVVFTLPYHILWKPELFLVPSPHFQSVRTCLIHAYVYACCMHLFACVHKHLMYM